MDNSSFILGGRSNPCRQGRCLILIFRLLARLPLAWLHALGAGLGWAAWIFSPTYRRHMRENMQIALGDDRARRIRPAAIAEAGKALLELPKIWLRPQAETAARVVEVSGWDLVEAAWRGGRGIVFLTPHLGCFEVTAQFYAAHAPITVLYRQPKQAWLQAMIEEGRARERLHLAAADLAGVRTVLKALRRGEAVGVLPDQAPKVGEGRWLDFFGQSAYTMTFAARLTESDPAVILTWAERLAGGAGYRMRLLEPSCPLAGSTEQRAQQINHELEQLIASCPEQYLWGYNRYKRPAGAEAPPESGGTLPQ